MPKAFTLDFSFSEPRNAKQALTRDGWRHSMHNEFDAFIKNKTWVLVPPFLGRKIIGSK